MMKMKNEMVSARFAPWFRYMFEAALNYKRDKCIELLELSLTIVEATKSNNDPYPTEELKWLVIVGMWWT